MFFILNVALKINPHGRIIDTVRHVVNWNSRKKTPARHIATHVKGQKQGLASINCRSIPSSLTVLSAAAVVILTTMIAQTNNTTQVVTSSYRRGQFCA